MNYKIIRSLTMATTIAFVVSKVKRLLSLASAGLSVLIHATASVREVAPTQCSTDAVLDPMATPIEPPSKRCGNLVGMGTSHIKGTRLVVDFQDHPNSSFEIPITTHRVARGQVGTQVQAERLSQDCKAKLTGEPRGYQEQSRSGITPSAVVPPILPDTVNIFLTPICNYRCNHCYATFADIRETAPGFMPIELVEEILASISREPLPEGIRTRKVTFVGGEPTLSPNLVRFVRTAKRFGLETAVITNGTKITPAYLDQFAGALDWMGFSIDSFKQQTNHAIGRCRTDGITLSRQDYLNRIAWVKERGIALKINTVVNAHNWREDMNASLVEANPERWKILQVTPIQGQNDEGIRGMQVTPGQFQQFVDRHAVVRHHGITMVPETVEVIRGSYAMISPEGCFFDSAQGRYLYSEPISKIGLSMAFSQVAFDGEKFHARGGRYTTATMHKS